MCPRLTSRRPTGAGRAGCVALVLVFAIGGSGRAQQSLRLSFHPANETVLQNYSPEFPPIGALYALMRSQVMADHTARLLRDAPAAPETFEMLVYMERREEAVQVLRRIIQSAPAQMEQPFELLLSRNLFPSSGGDGDNPLPQLIADARSQFGRLPRADAGRVERVLVLLETRGGRVTASPTRSAALQAFIARYGGTDAAAEAEVDLITLSSNDRATWIAPLDEIVRQHPGTTAAAKARFEKAFQLSTNLQRRGVDPTEQMLEVFSIVKDLESGRYPRCEWTTRAHWLGLELRLQPYLQQPISPVNADRLVAAVVDFVAAHFRLPELGEAAAGLGSTINGFLFDLFARKNDGVGGVERTLSDLEGVDQLRACYLRGAFYVDRLRSAPASERAAVLNKARDALALTAAGGTSVYARRSLATLASLDYAEGDFVSARTRFAAYLSAYPSTAYSWVAAIRIGQCEQLLGNLDAAAAAFRAAATRYADVALARELGNAYAGRANEQRSRFDEAAADYERALAQWGDLRRTSFMESHRAGDMPPGWTFVDVSGLALDERMSQLRASLKFPEGPALERGRSLVNDGRRADAIKLLEGFLVDYPQSALAGEARRLSHRAQLAEAVDLARPSNPRRDDAAALATLAALAREPYDDVIAVGQAVRATMMARQGQKDEAASLMVAALRDWQRQQPTTRTSSLPADIARDVAEIRTQVFEREDPAAPWRKRFEWRPGFRPPYQVINPQITVAPAGAVPKRETVYPTSTPENTLFMPSEQMSLLVESLNALADDRRGAEGRPAVFPRDLMDFITAYLPAEQEMIGRLFTFASVPNVLSVTFIDQARTRADVGIRTWSSGGTLRVEKQDGAWHVTGVAGAYVN